MPYVPPNFNLLMAVWEAPAWPVVDFPTFFDIPAQLYRPSRDLVHGSTAYLRIPASNAGLLDWPRNTSDINVNPRVECPQGSGSYYTVDRCLWMHRGFPNEYLALVVRPIIVRDDPPLHVAVIVSDTDLIGPP